MIVAERLGWYMEQGKSYWTLVSGDGETRYNIGNVSRLSERTAWETAYREGYLTAHSLDSDHALSLPITEGAWFEVHVAWTGATFARVAITISSTMAIASPDFEKGGTHALAVVRAWLAYCERGTH